MNPIINQQIVKVTQEIAALEEKVRHRRRDLLGTLQPIEAVEALIRTDLDGALFALSELHELKAQAVDLLATLHKLRAAQG